jgi:AraC-like DNA-binding protein
MSTALAVYHGPFGRATLYRLNKPIVTHAHREGHLVFQVDGGQSIITIGNRAAPINPNQAAAVSPLQPHGFVPGNTDDGAICLVLYINPSWFMAENRGGLGPLRFGRSAIEISSGIAGLVQRISALLQEDQYSDQFDHDLYQLTQACFDQSWQCDGALPMQRRWQGVSDYRIRNSIRIMKERVGDELDIDSVARSAGLSRPHFYKLFRQNIGITPNIYLNTLRMENSIERLIQTSDSITAIGLDLGFSSQASFTRFFVSNVGIPPTDYRRATTLYH